MTSTDGELGHAPPVASYAEGDFPTNVWDRGSYLAAVRQDLASAFAPVASPPPAFQGTNPIARPLGIQSTASALPRRTPIHGRPIILRDLHKHSNSLLTQEETSRFLRSSSTSRSARCWPASPSRTTPRPGCCRESPKAARSSAPITKQSSRKSARTSKNKST
jgi:hypothetical protein